MYYNEIFRARTKALSIAVIKALDSLAYSDGLSVIKKQLIRSVTSVAANYRAMCRSRSEKERFSKICIVVEEADETLFWLELMEELDFLPTDILAVLKAEAEEILSATSAYKRKLQPHIP